jgi:hypothetical protein
MRHTARSHSRSSTSQRRKRVWSRVTNTGSSASSTTVSYVGDLLSPLHAAGSSTLGMTCGPVLFTLGLNATGTLTGLNSVKLGIIKTPKNPTAAQWDPTTQPELDWLYLNTFYLQNNSNPSGTPWATQGMDGQGTFHTRSRRKIEEFNETLSMFITPVFAGATALAWEINTSTLCLLP